MLKNKIITFENLVKVIRLLTVESSTRFTELKCRQLPIIMKRCQAQHVNCQIFQVAMHLSTCKMLSSFFVNITVNGKSAV